MKWSLWRNWLARSAVNRKVGGSSPPRDDVFWLARPACFIRMRTTKKDVSTWYGVIRNEVYAVFDGGILLLLSKFVGYVCRYKTVYWKMFASAGNRTRVTRVGGENSTTEPPMLTHNAFGLLSRCQRFACGLFVACLWLACDWLTACCTWRKMCVHNTLILIKPCLRLNSHWYVTCVMR